MQAELTRSKKVILALVGVMDLSLVTGQVVLAPATITQGVTLLVGTPASEFTISVVRTGLVTVDIPAGNPSTLLASNIIPTPPSSIMPTVFVTDSAPAATAPVALHQPFSLPTQQDVVTQAPCVSACLQNSVIASAAGSCALVAAGTVVDNACACLSAPLIAINALTNCASAACNGLAAGPAGLPADLVAVTSLYNAYCTSAVGAEALASAVASGHAVLATAETGFTITVTAAATGTDRASATGSTDSTAAPWPTSASANGTLAGNTTMAGNATFGGGATLTAGPSAIDPGITKGMASSMSTVGVTTSASASASGTKSEASPDLRLRMKRTSVALLVALTIPVLML